ncbi:MAG: TRAFs-binding domain-containing protein [Candidatus Magnetobacterium sp. LHC-1]|uniref:DUF4071 domain-containing protein n=1 Tax=Candidatus Magnetobacterium casense TaxID=1455061 RepID=A0ABS6S0Y9_9BACT|nr:TRAFs-binding domain-containing protein [Candidatus Magnetobacterium casensis]MBV6342307.1 DUF4071 domain-containing protein [Candidatus Magnetobacterium casensis]
MNRPLCFVLMPFGKKPTALDMLIDFDAVYNDMISAAIKEAGMEPLRADEEKAGGIIHKAMYERLILCEYAVADLTTANANVFYELGVRHAVRPWSTVLIYAEAGGQLPFDVKPLRAIPYKLNDKGILINAEDTKTKITKRLVAAKNPQTDSPIYQLVQGYPDVDHTKTDVCRELVVYSTKMKERLRIAREQGLDALRRIEEELFPIQEAESGVVIDLFLSYRGIKAWDAMIALVDNMFPALAATVMIREQHALALNRVGRWQEAERKLLELIDERGPSSETYGILGRVYKDRWEELLKSGDGGFANEYLDKAINAYVKGFEADWRDTYPGINAVTLMELKTPPELERNKLIPVVTYSAQRRLAGGKPDYWDYATILELQVLAKDEEQATKTLYKALAVVREKFEPETTQRNLRLIREARHKRGEVLLWDEKIEEELSKRAGR